MAPGDVRRQRREQVDEPDREGEAPRERRQAVRPSIPTQRRRAAVQPDPPGIGVPVTGNEIAPVLEDQPAAGRCQERGHEGEVPGTACPPTEDDGQDRDPEVPLVDPAAEREHARAERVAVEAQHEATATVAELGAGRAYPGIRSGYRGSPSSGIGSHAAAYATNCRYEGLIPGSVSNVPSRTKAISGSAGL